MKIHANSHLNEAKHHLYEIRDRERNEVYKYGICGKPLLKNGKSIRAEKQVEKFNRLVDWPRFYAVVWLTDVSGRKLAEEIEAEYIQNFIEKFGRRPRDNQK